MQLVIEGCYPMENDWSGTLQNNNIICIFKQKIKLFQLNKYDQTFSKLLFMHKQICLPFDLIYLIAVTSLKF